ncbi:MAG: hypothetical protein AAF548_07730 [Actinomycetota bacterium]
MPFDFMPLATGYVARLHGTLEHDDVLTMALTGVGHFKGAAEWVVVDVRDVDIESARRMVADVEKMRTLDRSARHINHERRSPVLPLGFVCEAGAYDEIVPQLRMAVDDGSDGRVALDPRFPRFDTLVDAFGWERVTETGDVPDWAVALDDTHRG